MSTGRLKRGPWTGEEQEKLRRYVAVAGEGNWLAAPQRAGLQRSHMDCRDQWMNHLRDGIQRGPLSPDEKNIIMHLHALYGDQWSLIADQLPGRTAGDIKKYWNSAGSSSSSRSALPNLEAPFVSSHSTAAVALGAPPVAPGPPAQPRSSSAGTGGFHFMGDMPTPPLSPLTVDDETLAMVREYLEKSG